MLYPSIATYHQNLNPFYGPVDEIIVDVHPFRNFDMYSLHKPHGGMEHRVIKMNNSAILSIRRLCANPMYSEASNQLNAFRNFPQTSKWENMEMDWVSVAQTLNAIYLMSKREGRLGGEEKQIICLCLFFSTKAISITSISFHSNSSLLSLTHSTAEKTDFCDWKLLFFALRTRFSLLFRIMRF